MIKRFFTAIENLEGFPRRVIFAGLGSALILLIFATGLFAKSFVPYEKFILSRNICKTAVTMFSEGIIFGLFIDVLLKRN